MAVFRQIQTTYWQDPFVEGLTPEEKFFYLYIMTNSKTSACGVYEITKRFMSNETGYNQETIEKLINRFIEYKKIGYDESTSEIIIFNWIKHNSTKSISTKQCIEKELKDIKNNDFRLFVNTRINGDFDTPPTPPLHPVGEKDIDIEKDIDKDIENENDISKTLPIFKKVHPESKLIDQIKKYHKERFKKQDHRISSKQIQEICRITNEEKFSLGDWKKIIYNASGGWTIGTVDRQKVMPCFQNILDKWERFYNNEYNLDKPKEEAIKKPKTETNVVKVTFEPIPQELTSAALKKKLQGG